MEIGKGEKDILTRITKRKCVFLLNFFNKLKYYVYCTSIEIYRQYQPISTIIQMVNN